MAEFDIIECTIEPRHFHYELTYDGRDFGFTWRDDAEWMREELQRYQDLLAEHERMSEALDAIIAGPEAMLHWVRKHTDDTRRLTALGSAITIAKTLRGKGKGRYYPNGRQRTAKELLTDALPFVEDISLAVEISAEIERLP